jgi:hypothetical protein
VPLLLTEETTLSFFSPCYALCLGHFEFKTLLTSSSAFSKRPTSSVPDHPIGCTCGISTSKFFGETKNFLHFANLQSTIQTAGSLRVLLKSSFKKLLLGTRLWQHTKMSTSLKSPDGLKDAECKKGQLSHRPPIPYVSVVDIITPKEELQIFKIKLPDASHLNMPIYSCGINKPYLAQINCCGPPSHQTEGAVQEVQSACQGCCKAARGIEESPRSRSISRHHLNERRCYSPQGGD